MKSATAGGPYKVPRQRNGVRAGSLAVAVHAVLLLFLWVGVSWQNNDPVEVQAEIWDMKVQDAAPPAPPADPTPEPEPEPEVVKPPPPAPKVEAPPEPKEDPEIALQRIKKKKLEEERLEKLQQARLKKEADEKEKLLAKQKAEQKAKADKEKADQEEKEEKAKALAAEKEKKKAAAEKLAKEKADKAAKDKAFAAEMSRITGAAAKGTTGTAAQSTGGRTDGGYAAAIKAKIKSNLVYGADDDSLSASYVITQLPTGEIIGMRKTKSSGSTAYDNAIENAITKSSPLPKKKDGTVEREITLDFKLKEMH